MSQLINVDTHGYCIININEDEYLEDRDEFMVECRTGMTSLTFPVKKENSDSLNDSYDLLDIIEDYIKTNDESNIVWQKLGYSGVMFIDWLRNAKNKLNGTIDTTVPANVKIIEMAFITGTKIIHDELSNNSDNFNNFND